MGRGEVASGEWPLGARGKLMTSLRKKQVPRCARNDNSLWVGALVMKLA